MKEMDDTRTYLGPDKFDLIEQIKTELGDEVVILSVERRPDANYEIEVALSGQELVGFEDSFEAPDDDVIASLLNLLMNQGVRYNIAKKMVTDVSFVEGVSKEEGWSVTLFSKVLSSVIRFEEEICFTERNVVISGARMSGKTSIALKLAIQLSNVCDIKCAVVTVGGSQINIDRTDATDVTVFGLEPEEMGKGVLASIMQQTEDYDLVFFDLPLVEDGESRGGKNVEGCLQALRPCSEMLIALDCRSSFHYQAKILEELSDFNIKGCVLTRVDQGLPLGGVVSLLAESEVPLSFLGTGAVIPDDVEPATSERLAWFYLNSSFF